MSSISVKAAFKALTKDGIVSAINIAGLSVAMMASIALLLWVQNEWSFDSFHKDSDRIYAIVNYKTESTGNVAKKEVSPLPLSTALQQSGDVELSVSLMPLRHQDPVLTLNNEPVAIKNAALVDSNWFSLFNYELLYGSFSTFINNPKSLLLTETAAKKYFGKTRELAGSFVKIDSSMYTVAGVLRNNPSNSSFTWEVYIPLASVLSDPQLFKQYNSWGVFSVISFVKLRKDADPQAVAARATGLLADNRMKKLVSNLLPLKALHLDGDWDKSEFTHGSVTLVKIFATLALLILVTGCINYINLSTSQINLRLREVSIKKIIGAGKIHLFKQFFLETFLLLTFALVLTTGLLLLLAPLFDRLSGIDFLRAVFSWKTWSLLLAVFGLALLLSGIYPALLLASLKPLNVFRGQTFPGVKSAMLRRILVVTQFAFTVVLVSGAIVIYSQMNYVRSQQKGYNTDQVLTLPIPLSVFQTHKKADRIVMYSSLRNEWKNTAGVSAVAFCSEKIMDVKATSESVLKWAGKDPEFAPLVSMLSVDEGTREVFGIQMKEGRWPDARAEDATNIMLNEAALAYLGLKDPVGKEIEFMGKPGRIIGIVKDFHYRHLREKTGPLVLYTSPSWSSFAFIKMNAPDMGNKLSAIKTAWQKFLPNVPFDYSFLDESFDALYKQDTRTSEIVLLFSLLSVFIAALGLFGLLLFSTRRRLREFAIRKTLGAKPVHIAGLLSREFLGLVIIATLLGVPVGWFLMDRWLNNFAYRIDMEPANFVYAGLLTIILALLIIGSQSIISFFKNPTVVLRSDR